MKKTVSLIIPAYNEEQVLPAFYNEASRVANTVSDRYDFEFLFINDGSTDSTLSILQELRKKDKRVSYVDLSRNFGKEVGMLAGFDYARGDAVVIIDADLQEPPALIPEMLEKWEEGYCDVYGERRSRNQKRSKKIPSKLFHKFLAHIASEDLTADAGDFRLLDRRCVDALRRMRESQRYTKGMYGWIGFNKIGIPYDVMPRAAGTTKWTFGKLTHLAIDGITSHSVVPLRMASYIGIMVSLAAFVFLVWVVLKALIWGDDVAGYPSLMAMLLFLGGVILLALGIIGEYLGRIFLETKNRPVYFANAYEGGDGADTIETDEKLKK